MLKHGLKMWIGSGAQSTRIENICSTRVTNIIALIVISVLLMQVPFAIAFWNIGGQIKLPLLITAICCLVLVPVLNSMARELVAKLTLVAVYTFYISASCWLWQYDVNLHYFLLLAVIACPFIFGPNLQNHMYFCMLMITGLFITSSVLLLVYKSPSKINLAYDVIRLSSALFFALASNLIALHIGRNVERSMHKLALERERSESLLLNILPPAIAQRLKNRETSIADRFEQASILFADIENFTPMSKDKAPGELVCILDDIFSHVDVITQQHKLEKIKTIGDGYMAAAGVPLVCPEHALQACQCALDIIAAYEPIQQHYKLNNGLRIGIASGEVVAGVIGQMKFCYDLWGEPVTLASRMESHGVVNQIQVSQLTYELAKHKYLFTERGKIEIKGLGLVNTYWLQGLKP